MSATQTALDLEPVEEWSTVPGFDDRYEVSNHGRVRSSALRGGPRGSRRRGPTHHIVNGKPDQDGYIRIRLFQGQQKRKIGVHQLVILAFTGERPAGLQVRHLDGYPTNNRLSNLTWGTNQQNIDDRTKHGTTARGETSGVSVLTEAAVAAIKAGLAAGAHPARLAEAFGVAERTVYHIRDGRTWRHVMLMDGGAR